MITVLRQYFTYDITNSCTFQVSVEITMRIENQDFFYFPINDLVADLKVTDSKGTELVILSDAEFKELKGGDMSKVRSEYFANLKSNLTNYEFVDKFRLVAILFNQESESKSYYEKISLSWVDKFENRMRHHISEYVEFLITQPKYGIVQGDESSLYLSVKTNDKYEIYPNPEIIDRATDGKIDHRKILDDERHKTYRFGGNFFTQVIQVTVKIGLPKMIRTWAKLGLISTIVVPLAIVIMVFSLNDIPQFSFHVIFGTIGFILG